MQIQRRQRRSNMPTLACGCLGIAGLLAVVLVAAIIILLPLLPGLTLQFVGFQPKGTTEQVLAAIPTPQSIVLQNPVTPPQAVVNLGSYGTLPTTQDYTIAVGSNAAGAQVATVNFTEAGLMQMCYQRTDLCSNTNPQYRNARIDLRPGGGVVYADVYVQQFGIWQPIGVVLRLDASGRQLEVAGVDVNGRLYALPPNEISEQISQIVTGGNEALRQLSLEAGGGRYLLTSIRIDDQTVTLVLQ
jgi:hypothetical protein